MSPEQSLFVVFSIIIVGFLAIDLGYFNRQSHKIEFKPALYHSLFWIGISVVFGFLIFLCPNCHSLQSTHRGKNIKKRK